VNSYQVKTTEDKVFFTDGVESILEGGLSSGVVFNYSCKNGQCGVCKTELLAGSIEEISQQTALTEDEKRNNKILTCCCRPTSNILIDALDLSQLHNIEIKTLPVRISSIDQLSSGIIEVRLRFPPNTGFKFLEGQFIDVIGPNSVRRSYSIASDATDEQILLLIKKVDGGVLSDYWFNVAKMNDLLRIEGPMGTFFLRDTSKKMLFLATGTGIAPIIGMLNKLDKDDGFEQSNDICLFWGNRNPENFIWQPDFKKIKVKYYPVLSKTSKQWNENVGYVQDMALSKVENIKHTHVFACGSNEMIVAAKKDFLDAGLPEKYFYSDAFIQSC